MKRRSERAISCLGLLALLGAAACGVVVPERKTVADRARELEPKCRAFTDESAALVLSPNAIDSVEPAYAHVYGPNGPQARLHGARIHVRPLAGLSRESMTRSLECHEARVTLGLAAPRANDPYVLSDHWLSIDVDSEGDAFIVLVGTSDPVDAQRVLERARLFAADRP